MAAKLEVDCRRKKITIRQFFAVEDFTIPGQPPQGFSLREIQNLDLAYQIAFNGRTIGGYRFKYCDCEIRFVLELRVPPAGRGDSSLRKGTPEPQGGGATGGPPQGGANHVVTISPKPDGTFDWGTGVDELGHDLGITDPNPTRTWFWRGRGGLGRVTERHIAEIFRNGRDNRAHYPPGHRLQDWSDKIACCCRGRPTITRLTDDETLQIQTTQGKKKAKAKAKSKPKKKVLVKKKAVSRKKLKAKSQATKKSKSRRKK